MSRSGSETSGRGIPSDEINHVKMKFYKGSSSKERGSGIGLAVCDEIVKFHGGHLDLENAEGGGPLSQYACPSILRYTEITR